MNEKINIHVSVAKSITKEAKPKPYGYFFLPKSASLGPSREKRKKTLLVVVVVVCATAKYLQKTKYGSISFRVKTLKNCLEKL